MTWVRLALAEFETQAPWPVTPWWHLAIAAGAVVLVFGAIVAMEMSRHERSDARRHADMRHEAAQLRSELRDALAQMARYPASVAAQYAPMRRDLDVMGRSVEEHSREIATLKGAVGEIEKRLRTQERKP